VSDVESRRYFATVVADLELRRELLRRRDADQAPRRRMRPGSPIDRSLMDQMVATSHDNVEWLKHVIAGRGWPGRSMVGVDGADAAWLIAQHADDDPDFQRECLGQIEKAAAAGEVTLSNLAYLTDRVMLKEKGYQRYGTQFQHGPGGPEPFPLEDPDRVDELRESAGLIPLAEYRKGFETASRSHFPSPRLKRAPMQGLKARGQRRIEAAPQSDRLTASAAAPPQ
jgi:hypothetical protein